MTGIILSIILILGGAGGPTGDFNDANAVDQPVATSESTTTVQRKK
jgi:hypothetical protein